jgi:hypothetical protein
LQGLLPQISAPVSQIRNTQAIEIVKSRAIVTP